MFYDRLGEAVANELVDWFNQVDATYKSELRETNEVNWLRFEAKLEQGLAQLRAEILAKLSSDVSSMRADYTTQIAALRAELKTEIAGLRAYVAGLEGRIDTRISTAIRDQTRFMFGAWAALLIPLIGLWFR